MSDELDSADFYAVIGYYNIGSLDRQPSLECRPRPDRQVNP
jgi:hypothetical protein